MSQPLPSETLDYKRYVDGLRKANVAMAAAIRNMIDAGDGLIAAIDGSTDQFEAETSAFSASVSAAERTLPDSEPVAAVPKIITVTIEGGLVQDVTGVPQGYELHVEDHDQGDESHPQWDAEKECFVTLYEACHDPSLLTYPKPTQQPYNGDTEAHARANQAQNI